MGSDPLFTARGTVTGGRDGHATGESGFPDLALSLPKELGGPGADGTTNPEELFALGYGACFLSAVGHLATKRKLDAGDLKMQTDVSLIPDDGSFALRVRLHVTMPNVELDEAKQVMHAAHEICPYSNATRGNVDVTLMVNDSPV